MNIHYTEIACGDINSSIYIGTETGKDGFEVGIVSPRPDRPGDESNRIPLIQVVSDPDGKLVCHRPKYRGKRGLSVLRQIRFDDKMVLVDAGAKRAVDLAVEEGKRELAKNVYAEVVNLMAMASSVGVRYAVVPSEEKPGSLLMKLFYDVQPSDPDCLGLSDCPIVPGAWELTCLRSGLEAMLRAKAEEERIEAIRKQALGKLSEEERKALGY